MEVGVGVGVTGADAVGGGRGPMCTKRFTASDMSKCSDVEVSS